MMKFDRHKNWVHLIKTIQSNQSSYFNYMGVRGPGDFGKQVSAAIKTQILMFIELQRNYLVKLRR